jgi:predicted nucleotidyltransferase
MIDIEKIIYELKNHKLEIEKDFNVKEIGVFGSYVRGEESSDSDIDILVDFEKPIDLFRFLDLEEKLSELFNKKVDLVSKKSLKPFIGEQILKEVQYL